MKTPKEKHKKKRRLPGSRIKVATAKRRYVKKRKANQQPDPVTAKADDFEVMSSETLLPIVRRALELQGRKFHLWEIGEQLQKEYQLTKAPSEATVWRWCNEAHTAYLSDIKALRGRELSIQLQTYDNLLRTWIPRAMGELHIMRMRMINGEAQEVLDKQAIEEQTKAASVVIKVLEKKADLLGLDKAGGLPSEEGGTKTAEQLHAALVRFATQHVNGLPQANAKPAGFLELESGVEHLEAAV